MTPAAVVWDIGNVLIGWQPERFYDERIGDAARRALFAAVDLHAMHARIDAGAPFRDTVEATAAERPDWAAEIRLWHDRWEDLAGPALPRSVRLLQALLARGVRCFALSNFASDPFARSLAVHPFLGRFDRLFLSGPMGVTKPDPAIYARLEAETGIAPAALLFTDDRAENVAAAAARGWQTHLFDGADGWAARLVAAGLLTEQETA
ncbi:HAD-IA family hydrolase [Frigidibacter sp. MR17.14]|uniref:HAD-IA family hydrolase n=1 Tax=Frigidibacter sp. MR17.14 TaxID=3126509 RepID=UPI003012F40E